MSLAQYGPVQSVPENYVPEVLISAQRFEQIYANRNAASDEEKFYARDYVVDQLHRCAHMMRVNPQFESVEDVLIELPADRLEALYWGVDTCTCCWRHGHNKPESIDSLENRSLLDVATQEMVSKKGCFCYCRMYKRMLRRTFVSKYQ